MIRRLLFVTVLMILLVSCTAEETRPSAVGNLQIVTGRDLQIVTGQIIYVPAYSEIFYGSRDRTFPLGITLAVHNTDLEYPIFVQSVRYYDTKGDLVLNYVEETIEMAPLETIAFVVNEGDQRGGFGANFIVEWGAEQPVHEPIVEAIMVSTRGTQGISMISPGRILSQTRTEPMESGNTP